MTEQKHDDACGAPSSDDLLCFYVGYHTKTGVSWRIVNTPLNLDKAADLKQWIEEEEERRGEPIAPVFWKRLGA